MISVMTHKTKTSMILIVQWVINSNMYYTVHGVGLYLDGSKSRPILPMTCAAVEEIRDVNCIKAFSWFILFKDIYLCNKMMNNIPLLFFK